MSLPAWTNEWYFNLLHTPISEVQQPERKKSHACRLHDKHVIPLQHDCLELQSENRQHTTQIGVAGQ